MKRFRVPPSGNTLTRANGSNGGRPGVGKDGAAGVRVQCILPAETVGRLDAHRGKIGRGPAARRAVERFLDELENPRRCPSCDAELADI